jgi:ribonuclease HI
MKEPECLVQTKIAQGRFTQAIAEQSSNFREVTAVIMALHSFKEIIQGKRILIRSDNSTTVAVVNKWKTTSIKLQEKIFELIQVATDLDCRVTAIHLPGVENGLADMLSRLEDSADWMVNEEIFEELNSLWGPVTIDRFSSFLNAQVPRYNSMLADPNCEAVDAFKQNWRYNPLDRTIEQNWMNPPFHLLLEVVMKIIQDKANTILVTPAWTREEWFKLLKTISQEVKELPRMKSLFLAAGVEDGDRTKHRPPTWSTLAWKISFN